MGELTMVAMVFGEAAFKVVAGVLALRLLIGCCRCAEAAAEWFRRQERGRR